MGADSGSSRECETRPESQNFRISESGDCWNSNQFSAFYFGPGLSAKKGRLPREETN